MQGGQRTVSEAEEPDIELALVTLDALALHVHFALGRDDGLDIVGLGQGAHIHIVVHQQELVFQVCAAESVALHLLDAGGIHAVPQQRAHDKANAAFALAALALEDHHALPFGAGNEAIADILLKGWDVLRVEQIGKKPQPDNRLSRLRIVVDRKPAAHDLRPSRKKTAVSAERPVLHMNLIRIWREALCMSRQLHDRHDIGNGARNVLCGAALQLGVDFFSAAAGLSAVRPV